jgi:hypothetical protein
MVPCRARSTMVDVERSRILTVFAILLVLLAINDFIKPLLGAGTAVVAGARVQGSIVFFGMRPQGSWMFVGWLVAAFLLTLAIGVWRMRRYASPMADCYAVYVLLNVVIHTIIHLLPKTQAEVTFTVVYETVAVVGAWTLAILLRRERTHLN